MPIPKILLLGNGINIGFGGSSWNEYLREISGVRTLPKDFPMSYKPVVLTEDHVDASVRAFAGRPGSFGSIKDWTQRALLCSLLNIGFDEILTTNYTYELECAAAGREELSRNFLVRTRGTTQVKKAAESKYLIHTFQRAAYAGKAHRIWHIHGGMMNPDSIVLSHYFYENLTARYKRYFDEEVRNRYLKEEEGGGLVVKSWLDAFVIGDVYIMGFGFDFSETDLWWLLERKKREKAKHGRVFYFAPYWEDEKNANKYLLMRCYDVTVRNEKMDVAVGDYRGFYQEVVRKIKAMIDESDRTE